MRKLLAASVAVVLAGCAAEPAGVTAVPGTDAATVPATVEPSTTAATTTTPATTTPAITTPTTPATTPTVPPTTVPPTTVPPTTVPPTTVPPTTVPPTVATTTVPPATSVPPRPGRQLALDLLGSIGVENEHRGGYDRDLFGYPADEDGDGCNTRAEVLAQESSGLVQIDQPGCIVREGDWVSLYDGLAVTDAAELEIDHVVALKEAWDSGAWRWDASTLVAYGNDLADPRTLRAVTSSTNRSKSDKDPSNWLPAAGVCEYLADWVTIKARWSLTMDQSEYGRIRNVLRGDCQGTTVGPFVPVASAR